MSTSAQPLGTRPPVLSHRDVILNRSLSQLSPQENHLEYNLNPDSTESTGVQRQETTSTQLSQRRTIHPSHGQHWGTTQLSRGERYTPSHGHTQHMGSLTGRLNSRIMSHEENVEGKEASKVLLENVTPCKGSILVSCHYP
jgi:hypothetical protein